MARLPLASTVPLASTPPIAGHPTAGYQRPPEEVSERRLLTEQLLRTGATSSVIYATITRRFADVTPTIVKSDVSAIRARLLEELNAAAPFAKAAQVDRLMNDLSKMRTGAVVNYGQVAKHEHLVAEIEGTFAPRRLRIEQSPVPDALAEVLAGMSEASIEKIIAEERQRDLDARAIVVTASP